MEKHEFTKNIEKMVDPIEVGTIHFMQSYAKMIPPAFQYRMIENGAKKSPYMGFVVEPYSFFLCYEIKDTEWAKRLLPDNYELIPTKIFDQDEEAKYYGIFGSFNVHTSAFWGARMELYIIAQNRETGLLSWVIIDYDTNTVSFDEKQGLATGNTQTCIVTTNYQGEIIIDIHGQKDNRRLSVAGDITNGSMQKLNQRLWLEGNLSVTYGRELSNNKGTPFAVVFNPKEVEQAYAIANADIQIEANTWYPGLFEKEPSKIVCFPFAQHFLADSPGHFTQIKDEEELRKQLAEIDFEHVPRYSSKSLKKAFQFGQGISIIVIILLVFFLIVK